MSLIDKLRDAGVTDDMTHTVRSPVWSGPESNTDSGGITFSLLARYLVCKERFRLYVMEGLRDRETFNHRLEYGNMWHLCEEIYARHKMIPGALTNLHGYCEQLCKKYPLQREEIDKWYNVCRIQFPIYVDYWSKHPDTSGRTNIEAERAFRTPYILPSGRTVYLRGKRDSVDLIEEGLQAGIYLQENKTKGDIDQQAIERQLTFDLQTMIYMVALEHDLKEEYDTGGIPLAGVRYNVVRRPLSGGKGTIVQHKGSKKNPAGETKEEYYARLTRIINGREEDAPGPTHFFMRWKCGISLEDIEKFKRVCLTPILENLCDDYRWWKWCYPIEESIFNHDKRNREFTHCPRHFIMPYGIQSSLLEGGESFIDYYIKTGNEAGLMRTTNLFPELQG